MEPAGLNIARYVDAAWRRKWLILIPFLVTSAGALYYSAVAPPVYRSETTILVEPQQVPENYVQSTVTGSVQDRLNTISQQILSRTMLESVIVELNLYPAMRQNAPMEEVVNLMRKNVEIQVESQERGRRNEASAVAFRLTFYSEDPGIAQRVTQKLATLYIEENLRVRENMARGTKEFLEKQLQSIEQELKDREERIRVFKQSYMGALPEQLDANLRALDQLQQQRGNLLDSLRSFEDRQLQLDQQLAGLPQNLQGAGLNTEQAYRDLDAKRQELAALSGRYTPQYPDVIRLRQEIEELERQLAEGRIGSAGTGSRAAQTGNPAHARLRNQVEANGYEIANLRSEIRKIDARMISIRQQVADTPSREQELITLTRDYETIKTSYDSMMARKINAEIAENLEIRQKSEQFRILDPAYFPQEPFKPDRLRILGLGLALGLALGGGVAVVLEFLDRSLRSVEDAKGFFTLPVIAVIPDLVTEEDQRRSRRRTLSLTVLGVLLLVGGGVVVFIYFQEISSYVRSLVKGVL